MEQVGKDGRLLQPWKGNSLRIYVCVCVYIWAWRVRHHLLSSMLLSFPTGLKYQDTWALQLHLPYIHTYIHTYTVKENGDRNTHYSMSKPSSVHALFPLESNPPNKCVCMYVFMYVCMYVCMYYACMYVYMHVYMNMNEWLVLESLLIYVHVCKSVCKNVCMYKPAPRRIWKFPSATGAPWSTTCTITSRSTPTCMYVCMWGKNIIVGFLRVGDEIVAVAPLTPSR